MTHKANTRVMGLLKLFEKIEYAEAFRAGKLRFRKLGFFREYVDVNGELRGDSFEGVGVLLQPAQIGAFSVGGHNIDPKELVGPICLQSSEKDWSVLCFYALTNAGLEDARMTLEQWKEALRLHDHCYGLGSYVVTVTRLDDFAERVRRALHNAHFKFARSLVEYYDPDTFHGAFPAGAAPFRKRKSFEHQREYRFAIYADEDTPDPLVIDIGDISDISQLVSTEEFNRLLEVVPSEPHELDATDMSERVT